MNAAPRPSAYASMRARIELLREQEEEHGEQEAFEHYPSDEELEAYYADQDAQVAAYRS